MAVCAPEEDVLVARETAALRTWPDVGEVGAVCLGCVVASLLVVCHEAWKVARARRPFLLLALPKGAEFPQLAPAYGSVWERVLGATMAVGPLGHLCVIPEGQVLADHGVVRVVEDVAVVEVGAALAELRVGDAPATQADLFKYLIL